MLVLQRLKKKMGSCDFCKKESSGKLKSCVCGKASYCSKECQAKDWKAHKPSCHLFVIRESPGKGRGLFATRRIKEGQIILEEYPLLAQSACPFLEANPFPNIDADTKAKILQLHDPAENLKTLDSKTVKDMVRRNPVVFFWKQDQGDEKNKILRIFTGDSIHICEVQGLYDTFEAGLYHKIALINHACVPNTSRSWVMGDFQKQQLRAMMVIEKDEEILINYQTAPWFIYGSRESRRRELLQKDGFVCECSECSLEGWQLEDSDGMRADIREKEAEFDQLLSCEGPGPVPRKDVKKALKLSQQRVKIIQKLNLRAEFVGEMIKFSHSAMTARESGIICENDPEVFEREALKYAKMFGDRYIHFYNRSFTN